MIPILKKNEPWPEPFPEDGFVVLIDKPEGWTSFDVVNKIRHSLKIKKVGHAGTLDPFATGLLIVGVGKGTKQMEHFSGLQKRYVAQIHLGVETDTYDVTGQILEERALGSLNENDLQSALEAMVGKQMQMPPMYSAKKVNGVPLYKLARKGKVVERKAVPITIYQAQLVQFAPPFVTIDLLVSKGTYIRSFAHDFGKRLGVGGHLKALQRTQIGPYRLEESFAIEMFVDLWKTKVNG